MIILDTHNVQDLPSNIRFVHYAIGLFPGIETKNAVKKALKKGRLLINENKAETGIWVKKGDRIDLLENSERPKAYLKKIAVIYEDAFLAVVDKPAGLVVSGNQFKTLENCLVDQLQPSNENDALQWGLPVHRLDASTSGLVLFAKTMSARRKLGDLLQERSVTKQYHAVVHGVPGVTKIELPVGDKPSLSKLEVVRVVSSLQNEKLSLVRLEPVTGRTHQLRIHCQAIGHCMVGDTLYENPSGTFRNKGLFLAATHLGFQHPFTGKQMSFSIEIPNKFRSLLDREERRAEKYNP